MNRNFMDGINKPTFLQQGFRVMVSKAGREIWDHITAAIRGWRNRHSADIPGDHRKRAPSHHYPSIARRRATNGEFAGITIAQLHELKLRYNRGANRFVGECMFGLREEQMARVFHCINAHRSELNKTMRHLVNSI